MVAKPKKEKWMELCELAVNEQDADKLMALVAEIIRLLEVKQKQAITENGFDNPCSGATRVSQSNSKS